MQSVSHMQFLSLRCLLGAFALRRMSRKLEVWSMKSKWNEE